MAELFFRHESDIFVWISYVISVAIVILLATPIHECAHAVVAVKLGDPSPKYARRTSLNPFNHIDPVGSLMILLFGFGWAKPVGVDTRFFNKPKRDMALTAIAGPISNVLMGLVFYILYKLIVVSFGYTLYTSELLQYVTLIISYVIRINVSLAVFNLIPVPPLDGSRILTAFLPNRIYYQLMQYERYFSFVLIFLVFSNVLDKPLNFLINAIYNFFELITFFI